MTNEDIVQEQARNAAFYSTTVGRLFLEYEKNFNDEKKRHTSRDALFAELLQLVGRWGDTKNTSRYELIRDYQDKCAKMEDDMLGWKESAEAWERDARGLSGLLKMLEALAPEPGAVFDSVERILDDESAWVSRPIALAAMMIAERKMKLKFAPFVDALRLILPLAKGYAAEHQVGSNATYVRQAEILLDEKPLPGESCI